jgi:hypothetical protein
LVKSFTTLAHGGRLADLFQRAGRIHTGLNRLLIDPNCLPCFRVGVMLQLQLVIALKFDAINYFYCYGFPHIWGLIKIDR